MALRQAKNKVVIEGILSEISLDEGAYMRDDKKNEFLGGYIKIKTEQKINGTVKDLEIPVHIFVNKLKKDGTPNPAYSSVEKIKNEYKSIAVVGEDEADRVRITNGSIKMNEFYNRDGGLTSYPQIQATFVSKIGKSEYKPEATAAIELVVASKEPEVNKDGEETGRFKVVGVVPQYGGKVDVMPFYCVSEAVSNAISEYWTENETFEAMCKLDFSSTTETITTEVDFGEPIETTRTRNVSDIIISGGSQAPLEGDFAYDTTEIQAALKQRAADLEKTKEKSKEKKEAPKKGLNLGF